LGGLRKKPKGDRLKLFKRIRDLIGKTEQAPDPAEAEKLRYEFRRRYHWFGRLLRADRAALADIARIQEMLASKEPFGMVQAQTLCAHVSLEVWKIVDSMRLLAPGKYDALEGRFTSIRDSIESALRPPDKPVEGPLVLDMSEIDLQKTPLVGSKLAVLGEVANSLGLNTPGGFAVTAAGYRRFMADNKLGEEIERRIRAADATDLDELHALNSAIQQLIMDSPMPKDLGEAFDKAAQRYNGHMAVRSSALAEDASETSFAGLHHSVLNVEPESLVSAFKEVVAGLFSLPAMTYRFNKGIPDYDAVMCVGVLEMVEARSGGVLYTVDPLGKHQGMVINSVWGLPKPVVEGRCIGDTFVISKDAGRVEAVEADDKECKFLAFPEEGVERRYLDEGERLAPSLSEDEALALARVAGKLEGRFGGPLDMEWIVRPDGEIVVLQSRPLTPVRPREEEPSQEVSKARAQSLLSGGVTASPGVAGGSVRLVRKRMDMLDFPQGAVLVAPMALPHLATLLGRASAVVAETGSVTGHLATVCREYGVPAIFGLGDATSVLADGQEITVDADARQVLPGLPGEGRLRETEWSRQDTPVKAALKQAASRITPLNLLDPASPYFRPESVKTYHDITRFCHEKAVDEMFRFGRDHKFPERSSKQLYINVPTRWWVLNLDDGFTHEVQGKYVKLDEISCKPMLAIWQGVTAVPWEGPPPLDAGGFMSVMFRSTTDTSLAPGMRAKQTERNYFMISRHYCCLTSRLGYHFSTVETLVTGRDSENYAAFRFQGGAADDDRRGRRVRLIAEILENRGFIPEIRGDNLHARIQGLPQQDMFTALWVLGYLSIHTRQIDMVLSSNADVSRYANKLEQDMAAAVREIKPL